MSTPRLLSFRLVLLAMLVLLFAGSGMAFERNIDTTYKNGRTSSRAITTQGNGNGYSRSTVATGPRGGTATRSAQGQWDAESRTWTKSATATGPAGRTATSARSATRTPDGYEKSTTVTGPQGNSATRNAQGSWDPATRTWSKSAATTGSGGQSVSTTTTGARTAGGYEKSTTFTGPQGGSASRNVQGSWDPATRTWTKTVTGGAQ